MAKTTKTTKATKDAELTVDTITITIDAKTAQLIANELLDIAIYDAERVSPRLEEAIWTFLGALERGGLYRERMGYFHPFVVNKVEV